MAANSQAVISATNVSGWRIKTGLPLRMLGMLLVLAGVLSLLGWYATLLNDPATLPISKIRVQGNFVHLNESMLHQVVAEMENQSFFGVDIEAAKQRVEQLPWVAQASVRRIWPDTLGIEVAEQKAMARWANGGLVNQVGLSFKPVVSSYPPRLPLFNGPENMLPVMGEQYRRNSALLVNVGLSIAEVKMTSRHSLTLKLNLPANNIIELALGREQTQLRLERFIIVYKKLLVAHVDEIKSIDLRYSNGMSVMWKTGSMQKNYQAGE